MIPVPPSPLLLSVLHPFAVAFTRPTFTHVLTLVCGALLPSGRRTVTAALRAVGLGDERHFTTDHRVLNRAVWSPLALSRILLGVLVSTFLAPKAPLVVLIDGTLERRWGRKIALKGRYHDAVRSTSGHPVTTEGIHWLCLLLLAHAAGAQPVERTGVGPALPRHPDARARLKPHARQAASPDP